MDKNLTDITVVIDRSGSMIACKSDAEGGINSLIKEQREQPGQANFTLVQFDTEYEFVHKGTPIGAVPRYELRPRGSTALLDALGRAITETGERLEEISEEDRPSLVLFVVITDGLENASKEFNRQQIKEMIERQQDVYNWKFSYLGANQDSFAEAGSLGFKANAVADCDAEEFTSGGIAVSNQMSKMRSCVSSGQSVSSLDYAYSQHERKKMKSSK